MLVEKKSNFKISAKHPCLAGHFPGNPIVPGAVILDEVIQIILQQNSDFKLSGFTSVKFIQPLLATQEVTVQVDKMPDSSNTCQKVKFVVTVNDSAIAQGEARLAKIS